MEEINSMKEENKSKSEVDEELGNQYDTMDLLFL